MEITTVLFSLTLFVLIVSATSAQTKDPTWSAYCSKSGFCPTGQQETRCEQLGCELLCTVIDANGDGFVTLQELLGQWDQCRANNAPTATLAGFQAYATKYNWNNYLCPSELVNFYNFWLGAGQTQTTGVTFQDMSAMYVVITTNCTGSSYPATVQQFINWWMTICKNSLSSTCTSMGP